MNLKELDSFKMSDAVVLHDVLNPALFNDEHMRSDVRAKLLEIAEEFIDYLGVSNLDVKDITISGSNAAYSYTPHSDIDLHIIADMTKFNNDNIYRELFTTKKNLFNADHNIKVRGYDVELYVQDSSKPVRSLGEYSVERNKWIKFPSKKRANLDHSSVENKFKKLIQLGQLALRSTDMNALGDVLSTLKRYRQAGLDEHGEFGPENLAYKALRSQGLVDKLYSHMDMLKDRQLSLDETMDESQAVAEGQRGVREALVHRGYTQGTDPNDIWNVRDDNSRRLRHRRNEVVLAQAAPKIEQRVKVAYQSTTIDGSGQRYRPEAGSHYAYIQGRMTRGLPQGLETGRPLKFDGRKFMYADSGEIFAGADYVHFTSDRRVIAYNSAKPISVAGPEVSVGVTEDISNEIKTVTRIDSRPISDFTSNLKAYKHTDDWRQSGVDTGDDSYWKKNNLKTNTTKGLFAGDPHRTALYATGNAHETRYVEFTQNGQPVVYFDKKDLPKIRSRKTYLTVFDAANFKRLPTGEYFSNNPGQPLSQTEIGDPFQYITDHGWVIRYTDDLNKVFKKVKAMHKANKIPQYGAEGMAEGVLNEIYKMPPTINSSQGMADWAYQDAQDKKASSKGSLQGIPSEVYDMGDHLRVFVLDEQGPVLYLALEKFLDGFKSGAVAVEPRGRGKNLAVQVYQAVSDTFGLPIYSDTTQTDASRIGIWQKLMTSLPGRVVGYDQRTQEDLPLTATDQGPAVRSNQPVYTQRTAKDLSKPVTGQNRSRTRLLKLLPSQQGMTEDVKNSKNTYLWHGSRHRNEVLIPRQATDTGGSAGSNQNAIYATTDPKVAIAMGLTTSGSDTGMFPNDPQMVLFSGKIRKGEKVYLHKVPMYGPDGKPQFVQGGNSREFHSVPGVTAIEPVKIIEVPVNKYLNLIRKATRKDLELRNHYMRKAALKEASGYIPSEKEKNDPRFKTALTVDVHPDSIQQNAKKLGSKIARSGVPPTLKPSGKI